ncbi:MAG: TSUP family transporter [Candidatus Scalindua sp.]|nr:TSUP family transporter [Candidatus Scalindua sp.]MCR4344624.1 TSUP family transporter [Candidatus Scalindua sp.]
MEMKFMGTRAGKLMWILIKIAIMGLVMAGIIIINRKYFMEGSECAGICSLPLDISVYTLIVIIITSTVQSVFGVGVLLFGTPLLLLQYEKLTLVLPIVLPISIAINIFQVVKHYKYIDIDFYKRILFITIPFVIIFLALVLFLEAKFKNVGIGIFVGMFMLFVAVKSYSRKIEQILKAFVKYEKTYFAVMGIIHGLTNLGGSLLTAIVHEKNYPKDTTRVTVGVSYGTFALFQILTLLLAIIGIISIPGFAADNMNISFSNVIYLMVGVIIFLLTEKFLYTNIDNEKYSKIFAVFLFVSGILLIVKSM